MTTPTLKTARLTLTYPLIHAGMNVEHYLRWLFNESVTRYSEQRHLKHTEASQRGYIESFSKSNHHFWEIQRNATPIGSITAYRDDYNKIANVGIMVGETRVWGQAYGPEAWDAVCEFLFKDGIRKIEASCMASNRAMQSVLRRTNFRFEGSISGHFLLDGKPEDMECYGRHREAEVVSFKKEEIQIPLRRGAGVLE